MNNLVPHTLMDLPEKKVEQIAKALGIDYRFIRGKDKNEKCWTLFNFILYQNSHGKDLNLDILTQKTIGVSYSNSIYPSCVKIICDYLSNDYAIVKDKDGGIDDCDRIISDFEQTLAEQDIFLAFINEPYLKSKHCMYELCYFFNYCYLKDKDFKPNFVPILVDDCKIDGNTLLEYSNYWEMEYSKVKEVYNNSNGTLDEGMMKNLNDYKLINHIVSSAIINIQRISAYSIKSDSLTEEDLLSIQRIIGNKNHTL